MRLVVLLLCLLLVACGSPAQTNPTDTASSTARSASTCGAPTNPWRFNFCGKGLPVDNPPNNFCSYFSCVSEFFKGGGYVVECTNGKYSLTGGTPEACAPDGGVMQTLYEPAQ